MAQAQLDLHRPLLNQRRRLAIAGSIFVLPSIVLFVAFLAAPLVYSFYISFNKWSMLKDPVWLGLDNYRRIFDDDIFYRSLRNTIVFTVLFVPLVTVISLGTAVLLNQGIRAKGIFKALIFIPVITPSVVVGVVWTYVYQPDLGLLNELLRNLHLPTSLWLGSQQLALPALVAVTIWQRFGWFMILFLAGLQDIPVELKEAAALDGASSRQSFLHVTVPLLRPTVVLVTVLAAISAFQVFDLVFIMTEGGPAYATQTLSYYIYTKAFRNFDMGYAAAMSYVLFVVLLVLTLFQMKVLRPAAET
ncbi:MAG TPA: sugar ABC transporter permease [Thermomicrobiales bacterium]